jgi:hypothetical protein
MEQSLWEANTFSASQEILNILGNPKFHYTLHNCRSPIPILIPLPEYLPNQSLVLKSCYDLYPLSLLRACCYIQIHYQLMHIIRNIHSLHLKHYTLKCLWYILKIKIILLNPVTIFRNLWNWFFSLILFCFLIHRTFSILQVRCSYFWPWWPRCIWCLRG